MGRAKGRRELHHHGVAGGVEYPAAMLLGGFGAEFAEPCDRGDRGSFVRLGHGRKAVDIDDDNVG